MYYANFWSMASPLTGLYNLAPAVEFVTEICGIPASRSMIYCFRVSFSASFSRILDRRFGSVSFAKLHLASRL